MKNIRNKIILLMFAFFLVLQIQGISAALCKGYDGYYHNCGYGVYQDYQPYKKYDFGIYGGGYGGGYGFGGYGDRYENRNYYYDVEEYSRTTESINSNRYGYERVKTTTSETVEVEKDKYYPSYDHRGYYYPKSYHTQYYSPDRRWGDDYLPW